MAEGKDIVWAALLFTAGCGIAAWGATACTGSVNTLYTAAGTGFLFLIPPLFRLHILHSRSRTDLAALLFAAGLFCTFTAFLSPAAPLSPRMGKAWKLIDSIPYANAETGPLVKALLTGDRTDLPRPVLQAFRKSGASHILALSGLHMGFLYLAAGRLLAPLGRSMGARGLRRGVLLLSAGLFTLATGASPSVVRAFLFIVLRETALALHRKIHLERILCGALMLQLAISPRSILAPGFQLSYLAMTGIVFLFPKLEGIYPEETDGRGGKWPDLPRKIWSAAALAISCQATTAPLAWILFGTFPRYFLITNLIAMPLTTLFMGVALLSVGLGVLGIQPVFLTLLCDKIAGTLIRALEVIASL